MKKVWFSMFAATIALAVAASPSFADEKSKSKEKEKKEAKAESGAKNYWDGWKKIYSLDMFPECGVNVLGAGGDDVLQETVDLYCGVKPGGYVAYINPAQYDTYKNFKRGGKYPDGKLSVIVFKAGIAFTTDIKDGKPIMDVVSVKDGKSIASKDKGHPLNPETCFNCHETSQKGVCKKQGYMCGDAVYRTGTK